MLVGVLRHARTFGYGVRWNAYMYVLLGAAGIRFFATGSRSLEHLAYIATVRFVSYCIWRSIQHSNASV